MSIKDKAVFPGGVGADTFNPGKEPIEWGLGFEEYAAVHIMAGLATRPGYSSFKDMAHDAAVAARHLVNRIDETRRRERRGDV